MRDVATNDHEETRRCFGHDFQPYLGVQLNRPHTFWRCIWCHGVTCGDYGQADPCWEIYHHQGDHRTRSGVSWSLGGIRPDVLGRI